MGSDHAGYTLKSAVAADLIARGHDLLDLGTSNDHTPVDWPDFGAAVARAVVSGQADCGVAVCGTGIGVAIAANKISGARAATVHDVTSARLAKEHNHANVLCLGARLLGNQVALEAVAAWLEASYGEGRHVARLEKLRQLDEQNLEPERG